ncbi:MAG: hypothetical protein ACOWWH_06970 [Eubacteriaceae bacterium]
MKKSIILFVIIILLILFIVNFSYIESILFMKVYSDYNDMTSIMNKNNFCIHMSGGICTKEKDWFPFVMTFNDYDISKKINEDIDISIMYNFGAFENGRSNFYNEKSDYFSSFYGAYIIQSKNRSQTFGFQGNDIDTDAIMKITKYDLQELVLKSLGCQNVNVSFIIDNVYKNIAYLSINNWIRIDSTIISVSPLHKFKRNHLAYIQYGKPPLHYFGKDFDKEKLVGRMYCKYFNEYKCTILLYIIAPNTSIIEKTDLDILSKTVIN